MSLNNYYILIKGEADSKAADVIKGIGLTDYSTENEVLLYEANKPKTLYIGRYNDTLIVIHPDLPFHFFGKEQSQTERDFIKLFPDSEIVVLLENEQVGLFGYALIQKGVKVRMKDGADGEIFNDFGELLPEEKEMLQEIAEGKIFEEEELDEMREDMTEEEVQQAIAFEASWRTPGLLARRYFDGLTINNMIGTDTKITRFSKS